MNILLSLFIFIAAQSSAKPIEVHQLIAHAALEQVGVTIVYAPDSNIDHRRVPNLMKFFQRQGKKLSLSDLYQPGDIVAWQLEYGLYHIGIVTDEIAPSEKRYFMVHNIGAGAKKEDVLYKYKIIGHYRW